MKLEKSLTDSGLPDEAINVAAQVLTELQSPAPEIVVDTNHNISAGAAS